MSRIFKAFVKPLITASPDPIVALLSTTSIWWGIVLTLKPMLISEAFTQLLEVHISLSAWSFIFYLIGFGILLSKLLFTKNLERLLVWVSTGVWMYMTVFLAITGTSTIIFGTYFLLSGASTWAYWRMNYE
jgi:hypothetical protein